MKKINAIAKSFRIPALLLIPAFAAMIFPGLAEIMELRPADGIGLWTPLQIFAGHFAHFSWDHFAYDAAAFFLPGGMIEFKAPRHILPLTLFSGVVVSGAILLFCPEFTDYRGLSGVDSAFFVFAALLYFKDLRGWIPGLALTGFLGKILWECFCGEALFVETGSLFTVVPQAHLAGAAAGVVFFLLLRSADRKNAFPRITEMRCKSSVI